MKNSSLDISEIVPAPIIMRSDPWTEKKDRTRSVLDDAGTHLPVRERWPELLGLKACAAVEPILRRALLDPIEELVSIRGKRIRGQLVTFSYRLLCGDIPDSVLAEQRCRLAAEAVEFIHAGSLIVDDIEDGSPVRRGRPALHLRYGMPVALNAGNWLYFWPFDLFKELALPKDRLLHIYESCHRTLSRAHLGQAIDLGAKIDALAQKDVENVCIASSRLKTGALMGFATLLGAVISASSGRVLSILDDFGRDLGVALQMFDDLGNAIGKCEPSKRYEDLTLARPSWVWACAAASSTPRGYQEFLAAVRRLPDSDDLETWLADHDIIEQARQSAREYLDLSFSALEKRLGAAGAHWSRRAFDELRDLGEEIALAYG
jgi:geranylgeranyl pyrophosphate synthase